MLKTHHLKERETSPRHRCTVTKTREQKSSCRESNTCHLICRPRDCRDQRKELIWRGKHQRKITKKIDCGNSYLLFPAKRDIRRWKPTFTNRLITRERMNQLNRAHRKEHNLFYSRTWLSQWNRSSNCTGKIGRGSLPKRIRGHRFPK